MSEQQGQCAHQGQCAPINAQSIPQFFSFVVRASSCGFFDVHSAQAAKCSASKAVQGDEKSNSDALPECYFKLEWRQKYQRKGQDCFDPKRRCNDNQKNFGEGLLHSKCAIAHLSELEVPFSFNAPWSERYFTNGDRRLWRVGKSRECQKCQKNTAEPQKHAQQILSLRKVQAGKGQASCRIYPRISVNASELFKYAHGLNSSKYNSVYRDFIFESQTRELGRAA